MLKTHSIQYSIQFSKNYSFKEIIHLFFFKNYSFKEIIFKNSFIKKNYSQKLTIVYKKNHLEKNVNNSFNKLFNKLFIQRDYSFFLKISYCPELWTTPQIKTKTKPSALFSEMFNSV